MNLQCQSHGSADLITIPPQLVMANAPEARRAIKHLVKSGRIHLILDLKSVDFIDSSGLSVLVSTLKAVQEKNGEVVLLNPSDEVRSLIELTRLHQVFDIFEDRDAAIEKLS